MEHNGMSPSGRPIAVTGATGGVGGLAIDMLAGRGYEVVAITGKPDGADYLRRLGAAKVMLRGEMTLGTRPLETVIFGGAIDNVGGELLAWLTRTVDFWGSIASIGLTSGAKLETTVMPFILRGVNLLGINSSATPRDVRLQVWKRIASDLKPRHLDAIVTRVIDLDELPAAFGDYLDSKVRGRTVVRIG
jgi:NADPH2:quinone reductase